MDRLPFDSREIKLTVESVARSDKDIATISALEHFAQENGNILVLSGGYATEALCGGNITRPHGDIDAHLILSGPKSVEELSSGIRNLVKSDDTKWEERSADDKKIEFIEDVDKTDFFAKRRVEVYFNPAHEANMSYPRKKLIDSKGNAVYVRVVNVIDMVSPKMVKIFKSRQGVDTSKDRHTSISDYIDLRRLMELPEFDKEAVLNAIVGSLKWEDPSISDEEAEAVAPRIYSTVQDLLKKTLQLAS